MFCFYFFLLCAFPVLTVSLQCYTCSGPFTYNYTVTSSTILSFTNCWLVNAKQCLVSIIWLEKPFRTVIRLGHTDFPIANGTLHDYVLAMALLAHAPDGKSPLVSHDLEYGCVSRNKCNDEMNLKRILHSLIIEDHFIEELYPLIQVVQPFTNKSAAACYEYINTTDDCSRTSLDTCQRCQITIDTWSPSNKNICATCPKDHINQNWVLRESVFVLNNRTRLIDHAQLICQLSECNSLYNGNEIYRASKITFDFDEFHKHPSDNIL